MRMQERQLLSQIPFESVQAGGISTLPSALGSFMNGRRVMWSNWKLWIRLVVEAGTSEHVGSCCKCQSHGCDGAPASDMFEIGCRACKVLKRREHLFAKSQEYISSIYKRMNPLMKSSSGTPSARGKKYSENHGGNLAILWYWISPKQRDPEQSNAQRHPRRKMPWFFRRYLGLSSKWAKCQELQIGPGFSNLVWTSHGRIHELGEGLIWALRIESGGMLALNK